MEELRKVPRPKGVPVLGNVFDIDPEGPLASILELAKRAEYKEMFALTFGGVSFNIANTHAVLDELCDESRFKKVISPSLDELRPAVGDGLFTAHEGEKNWGIAHRILMPIFGSLRVKEMWPEMQDIALQLCLKWARLGEAASEVVVADDFTRLTLDTIALCAMGYRFNSFYSGDRQHQFVDNMISVLLEADRASTFPKFVNNTVRWRSLRKNKQAIAVLRGIADDIVQERRSNPDGNSHGDLLNAMLLGKDPKTGAGMTDKSIVDNLVTFLIAGHETTSGLLSFVFYYLAKNPEAKERARREVDEVVGSGPITIEHMGMLPYVTAVLREALRLQPTAPAFTVASDKEEVVGGKWRIPKGEHVMALLHAIHIDPAVWGDDAEAFRPERMLDENFNKLPKNAWKPFGNGSRGCIGRPFAWQEAMLVTTMVLQNFSFELTDPQYKLKFKECLTIKPDNLRMRLRLRNHHNATELASALLAGSAPSSRQPSNGDAESRTGGGQPMTLLYGSNGGTSEALAHRLADDAIGAGYSPSVQPLDSATGQLPKDQPVIIFAASYDGMPADNAAEFVEWLKSLSTTDRPLQGVSYAVFGCGHRDWVSTLYRIPTLVDQLLAQAGATRLAPPGKADSAVSDMFSDVEAWEKQHLWPALQQPTDEASELDRIHQRLQVDLAKPRRVEAYKELAHATVRGVRTLTRPGAVTTKKHIELDLPAGVSYMPGDHLVVLPTNPGPTVRRALARFNLPPDAVVSVMGSHKLPQQVSITAAELLGSYVELAQPATSRDIQVLATACKDPQDRDALLALAREDFESAIRNRRTSVLDLLERFPSLNISFAVFLGLLPSMRIRTYSISSSPVAFSSSSRASLTYSVLDQPALSGSGHRFLGVGSNYLSEMAAGDLMLVKVKKGRPGFYLADAAASNGGAPAVFIAAGSGLAPFRGYLQELCARGDTGTVLFLGCRGPEDDLYRTELDQLEQKGSVVIHRAYSRAEEQSGERVAHGYVQDALLAERKEVARLWSKGSKFYVCGGTSMASKVKLLVAGVARSVELGEDTGVSDEELLGWFAQFEPDRYSADIFA